MTKHFASLIAVAALLGACSAGSDGGNGEAGSKPQAEAGANAETPVEAPVVTFDTPMELGEDVAPSVDVGTLETLSGNVSTGAMPTLTWRDRTGAKRSIEDYRGKVLLVNFWGTWCPPCRAELPDIVSMREDLAGQGFEVIGVALERKPDDQIPAILAEFAEQNDLDYPLVFTGRSGLMPLSEAFGGLAAVPTTFVVDRNGRIVQTLVGMKTEEEFRQVVEPQL